MNMPVFGTNFNSLSLDFSIMMLLAFKEEQNITVQDYPHIQDIWYRWYSINANNTPMPH